MRDKFMREVAEARLPCGPGAGALVTESDVASLPEPARRYLGFMGVVGRPRGWSFRARWLGQFRLAPDKPWAPCEAWQYNTRLDVARIFRMRLNVRGLLPVLVRDDYVRGRGITRARVFDRIPVANDHGEETAIGQLVTYLNDAMLLAPSMVLGPEARWTPFDARSFDVTLGDRGLVVAARVTVDDRGALTKFATIDRFCRDPSLPRAGMVRTRWSTPVSAWRDVAGRRLPARGVAVWNLRAGPFAYADLRLADDGPEYDVSPIAEAPALEPRAVA